MNKIFAILGGLGAGAAIMYLMDPDRGKMRRALIRDKAAKFNRQASGAISGQVKDIGNRAKGMLHQAKSGFGSNESTLQDQPSSIN